MIITTIFNVLTHVIIVLGMIGMFLFIYYMIREEHLKLEKVIRLLAAVTGFLIYFGARATGMSIPSLMMESIKTASGVGFLLAAIVIPGGVGAVVAWYLLRALKKSDDVASRLVIMIAAFILVVFTDVYGATFAESPGLQKLATTLVPNLTFTVGLSLYVILKYLPKRVRLADQQESGE